MTTASFRVSKLLGISLVILVFAAFACGTESETICAAPDPLCDGPEEESSEPCGTDETSCRRVEIDHCGEPWIRYCRPSPGRMQ